MKSNKFKLLCLFCLYFPSIVLAQRYNIKTYSVNNGLPQSQVHDIDQTEDGYIWLATYGGGLTKFDGTTFHKYTTKDGLRDNLVEEIFVDSNDDIWVATDKGGVAKFRGDSLVYPIDDDSLEAYSVVSINETSDGSLWFGTYKGGIFTLKDQELERLTTSDGLSSNIIWNFMEAEDGRIWIATGNGVSVYDGNSFHNYSTEDGLAGKRIYKIMQRRNGNIWMATSGGLTVWDGTGFEMIKSIAGKSLGSIYDIIEASGGKLWIATRSQGIFTFKDGQFNHITKKNGLSSNYIYNLFEDRNNQIWIGTDEDGVNLYKKDGILFYNKDTGLSSNEILSVSRDAEHTLWFGTTSGIESFDGTTFKSYALPQQYQRPYIWNITNLPNGNILVATPDSLLMEFDGETYTNFSDRFNLQKLYIYDLMIDSANILWVGADNGLHKIDLENKTYTHFTEEDGLSNDVVFHIFEDNMGRKWIGTYYGLNLFDGEDFKTYGIKDGLVHSQINYITQDKKGDIWIGTRGGISVFKSVENGKPKEIENFDTSDGMLLLNTHFLWFDDNGSLWQGTNGGLQELDVPSYRKTGTMPVTHYPLSDEGLGLEFNFQAIDSKGKQRAWMGSMSGVVSFEPNKLENIPLTELSITNIKANNSSVNWSRFTDSLNYHNGLLDFPSVTFPSDKKHYEFTYQAVSFTNPANVEYRYRLEGFDKSWMPSTKNNSAVFTNLNPGEYTFVVQARSSSGSFSDNEARYNFSIAFPFWRTYWFYAFILISVAGFIYGYIRFRVNKLEKERLQELVDKQTEHLTEALKEKEVLIKEIHHRVKNNLAVISGLLELQIDNTGNDFASRVLSESQRRIKSISMIHEKLYQSERLAEIDFKKYVRELIDIITHSLNYSQKNIKINVDIDSFKLGVNQGIPCGLILNELVSNAYEHAFEGKSGTIDIKITRSVKDYIKVIVSDNGKGLPDDFEQIKNQSLGFTLVETLSNQLQGNLSWKNTKEGTEFVLEFEKEMSLPQIPLSN